MSAMNVVTAITTVGQKGLVVIYDEYDCVRILFPDQQTMINEVKPELIPSLIREYAKSEIAEDMVQTVLDKGLNLDGNFFTGDEIVFLQTKGTSIQKAKTISSKILILEEIGETAKITIFETALEAIEKKWESLYFSANGKTFAEIQLGKYVFFLETNGEVRIFDTNLNKVLKNVNEKEIIEILQNSPLDNQKQYVLESNNWFALAIGVIENGNLEEYGIFDDEVFGDCPETVEELEKVLIEKVINIYKNFNK